MVDENATQGARASVVMNEVEAVTRRLAKTMLMEDDLARFRARWPEIAKCFQSQGSI
jgi:hypothetical protein